MSAGTFQHFIEVIPDCMMQHTQILAKSTNSDGIQHIGRGESDIILRRAVSLIAAIVLILCLTADVFASVCTHFPQSETATESMIDSDSLEKISQLGAFFFSLVSPESNRLMDATLLSITHHAVREGHRRIHKLPPRLF